MQARLRTQADDFQVVEALGFEPDGDGEHALLQIRKRNANTEWVVRQLACHAGVRPVDVGYAGLKDRSAVTEQWFSVHLARRPEPDWRELQSTELQICTVTRHRRKLRRGALRGNGFVLRLRELQGDREELIGRLQRVSRRGVPNYFGPQRFGGGGENLRHAWALLSGAATVCDRHRRGLYLSAARSHLFNQVLSLRVAQGTWDSPQPGEVLMLDASHSFFCAEGLDEALMRRVQDFDLHPTGPLWGRGASPVRGAALAIEQQALAPFADWCGGLERAGLEHQRRALRVCLGEPGWEFLADDGLRLRFSLPPGSYATAVLRELVVGPGGGEPQ